MNSYTFRQLIDQDLLRVSDGYRAKNSELGGQGFIFLRGAYLQESGFDISDPDRFSKTPKGGFGDKVAVEGDSVITTKGNSTGRVGYVKENVEGAVYSPHLSYWRSLDHDKIEPRFLFYWSKSREFQSQLFGMAYSTDMAPYLSLRDQMHLQITLPSIGKQREIAATLGALDDKIEVNRKTAAVLEEMARALYRSWFVDFEPVHAKSQGRAPAHMDSTTAALFPDGFGEDGLPVGWGRQKIGMLCTIKGGKQLTKDCFSGDGAFPVFGGAGQMGMANVFNADGFVITVGRVGAYCGKFVAHRGKAWVNNNASLITPTNTTPPEFLFLALQDLDISSIKKGAAQPFISNGDLKELATVVSDEILLGTFNEQVNVLRLRSERLQSENQTLANLRDTLLPRLMSGELRVGEAREQAEAAQ